MNRPQLRAPLFFLITLLCGSPASAFIHPGVPFTKDDLRELKLNITKEPWRTGYQALAADGHASLKYQMRGPREIVSRAPHLNRNEWMSDMQAVHHLTFMWVFKGDAAYAKKATEILDAWAVTNTVWRGDEAILDLGDWVQCYATAADILKSTYPGWTAANTEHVNHYFADVLWPALDVPHPVRGANQGADAIKAAMGIAAFLDDKTKWDEAIFALRNDPAGGLENTLPNGEVGDSGRDEGHTAGQIWNLTWASEVAWKQGVDVFSDLNNRLLACGELYAKYNLEPAGVSYIRFGNPYALYIDKFGWAGGARRQSPFYNILLGAYVVRKKLEMPYLTKLRDAVAENKDTFLFRKTSDHSTAKPLPPLVHPTAKLVTTLDSTDIGNFGVAGSARFADGTWTISGAGNLAVPAAETDACHFAYKKLTGDAVLIARVTALAGPQPDAHAGLMIRDSLAPDARQVSIYLTPAKGAKTTWRGATAFCKTDTSWAIPTQTARNYEEHDGPAAPYWLKLERLGNRVTVYHSLDAVNWCCLENVELPLPAAAYIGLCVSSQDAAALNTVTFTDVALTPEKSPVKAVP